ncbi:hypothetical protein LTR27_002893 [Elasticomyces elasticus]|nr:hypothetical protein LTR27_002893 [Elasticomyces elasticus]
MKFSTGFHDMTGRKRDFVALRGPLQEWADLRETKKNLTAFVQIELVNPENSTVLEKRLGSEVSGWHRSFVMEQADFAHNSEKNIKAFLSNRDPTIKQKARIALLLIKIVKAAPVPGAGNALDQSDKTVVYRLSQAATLLLTVTFDLQTNGYSSHFRNRLERKSIRPFVRIMLDGMLVQLMSITPPVATSQLSTVATSNTLVRLPSQTMTPAIVDTLFLEDFFLLTTKGRTNQRFRNGIVDWAHEGDVFTVLVSFVKTELSDDENSALLEDRLTPSVLQWHFLFVKDVASFTEKKSAEIKVYLQSADAAGAQRCRLAQYVKAILKVARVPGSKSAAYGNDTQPHTLRFRYRMIVTLLLTIVFDLQSKGSRSYFIKLLEGRGMQPFASIMHNGHPVQKSTTIREIPTALPLNFLDPLALITQPSAYEGPTTSDGADMETTKVERQTKGDDGKWLFREKSPLAVSEHSEGSKKKTKAAPKKKTDWLVDSDDDDDEDENGAALDVVADKKKAEALKAPKSQTAIPKSVAATGSKSTEGTTARPVQQGRKREIDDTGAKSNGDPKRRRTEGDRVPTAVHKPSHSSKSSAAAPAGFGNAAIATDGAVVGREGDMASTAPKKSSGRIKPSATAPGRSGKAGMATDGARKTFAGKSKEQTTGRKAQLQPKQIDTSDSLFVPE